MILILDTWGIIITFVLFLVAFKALIGFHWPWEKCACCGKKYREHKKTSPPLPISKSLPRPLVKTEAFKKYKKAIEEPQKKKNKTDLTDEDYPFDVCC